MTREFRLIACFVGTFIFLFTIHSVNAEILSKLVDLKIDSRLTTEGLKEKPLAVMFPTFVQWPVDRAFFPIPAEDGGAILQQAAEMKKTAEKIVCERMKQMGYKIIPPKEVLKQIEVAYQTRGKDLTPLMRVIKRMGKIPHNVTRKLSHLEPPNHRIPRDRVRFMKPVGEYLKVRYLMRVILTYKEILPPRGKAVGSKESSMMLLLYDTETGAEVLKVIGKAEKAFDEEGDLIQATCQVALSKIPKMNKKR